MSGFSMGGTPRRRVKAPAFRPLKLFGRKGEPATRWLRITLAEKLQHDLDFVEVDARHPPDELLLFNPTLQLPMLLDRDVAVVDAAIIAEYINERFPHPPMMPTDPAGRARLRLMVRQAWDAQAQFSHRGQLRLGRDLLIALAPLMTSKGLGMASSPHLGDSLLAALLPLWLNARLDLPESVAQRVMTYHAALSRRAAVHSNA